MKRLLMTLFMAGVLLIPSIAFTFQNEPDNFRGIKWGTNINELPGMKSIETIGDLTMCEKKDDKMKIGDADVDIIRYHFYKDRFYAVLIAFSTYLDFSSIKQTLFSVYGKGDRPNRYIEKYWWAGYDVVIGLKYSEISEKGYITYSYMPIFTEYQEAKKKKSEEGAKDL